jgi:hypothetical protein
MKPIDKLLAMSYVLFGGALLSAPAVATVTIDVPEPGVLSLLGLGGVIVIAMTIRNRRK